MKEKLRVLFFSLTALSLLLLSSVSSANHDLITQEGASDEEIGCFPEAEEAAARLKQSARQLLLTINRYEPDGEAQLAAQRMVRIVSRIQSDLAVSCDDELLIEAKEQVRNSTNRVRQEFQASLVLTHRPDAVQVFNRLVTYSRRLIEVLDKLLEDQGLCSSKVITLFSETGQRLAVLADVAEEIEWQGITERQARQAAQWVQQEATRLEGLCDPHVLLRARDRLGLRLHSIQRSLSESSRLSKSYEARGAYRAVLIAWERLNTLIGKLS